ncbi:MAG: hypothetical protein R3A44_15745 [Caldilineaceae bacterium]
MIHPKRHRSDCYLWFSTLISLIVLLLLLTILAACNNELALRPVEEQTLPMSQATIAPFTETLPHLLGVIQMPPKHGLTRQGLIHPNGYAYILNYSGSIIVADGPNLVDLMTWPEDMRGRLADITINPSTGESYVIGRRPDFLHTISGTGIVKSLPLDDEPQLLAYNPATGYTYIPYLPPPMRPKEIPWYSGIAVFNGTELLADIPLNAIPHALTVNPIDGLIYVGHGVDKETLNSLTVISGTAILTSTSFASTGGSGIEQMIVNPHTGEMYLKQGINVIHRKNGSQISSIDIGGKGAHHINSIAIDTRRNWIYATSWEEPTSQVLVLEEDKVIASIPVGRDPRDVVVDETHDYVYVVNRLSGSMSIIRGTEVITTVGTEGWGPAHITLDEQRGYIYVSNSDSASVAVFGFDSPSQ